ncbi:MAG: hypothetical protein AB9M60_11240, partial [Leptothrix sp. (in: b-proteobacteria)]
MTALRFDDLTPRPLRSATTPATDPVGFEIGWDHARHGVALPDDCRPGSALNDTPHGARHAGESAASARAAQALQQGW